MDDKQTKISEIIKNLQQVILKNTASLNDETRSKVYSKLQNIKFKFLSSDNWELFSGAKDAAAFFSPYDNAIFLMDKCNLESIDKTLLLHEILHAISSVDYDPKVLSNNNSGIKTIKTYQEDQASLTSSCGRGINEAATQFFAERFLNSNDNNFVYYPFEVHLFKLLCDECGYEEIKNAYFSTSIDEFKKVVRNSFKLKDDYLTDNLITNMDTFAVIYGKDTDYFKNYWLMKNSYSTLLQMKFNKMLASIYYMVPEKEFAKHFNAHKYLAKDLDPILAPALETFFEDIEQNKLAFLDTGKRNKLDFESARLASIHFANAIMKVDVKYLEDNLEFFKQNSLEILKQLTTENIYCQKDEKTGQNLKMPNETLIYLFLGILHDKTDKIDLSIYSENEKYEFMSLALYNRYLAKENLNSEKKDTYKNFYPKDLVHFINSGYYECDTFFDEKAMEYIWPEIKHIDPKLLYVKEFALAYKNVRDKHIEAEKNLKK